MLVPTVVALYTSAWIEIGIDATVPVVGGVALYTSAWIEISLNPESVAEIPVALYTSAWIEILLILLPPRLLTCRTLHECVD